MFSSSSPPPLDVAFPVGTSTGSTRMYHHRQQASFGARPGDRAPNNVQLLPQSSLSRPHNTRSDLQQLAASEWTQSITSTTRTRTSPWKPQIRIGTGLGLSGHELFADRDAVVHNLDKGLRRQGSLSASGEMSPSAQVLHARDRLHRMPGQPNPLSPLSRNTSGLPFTPTTPAFFPSPTSPSTSSIPCTPSMEYGPTSPYSTPPRPSPLKRGRSGSASSLQRTFQTPSPTYKLSPGILPIGRTPPKWREPRASSNRLSPGRRFSRVPAGPRPMLKSPGSSVRSSPRNRRHSRQSSSGLSGSISSSPRMGSSSPRASMHTKQDQVRARRERRVGIDLRSQSQLFEAIELSISSISPVGDNDEEADARARGPQHAAVPTHRHLDNADDENDEDFSWDAEDNMSVSDTHGKLGDGRDDFHDNSASVAADCAPTAPVPKAYNALRAPSPLRIPKRHPRYPHPASPKSPIALPTLTVLIPNRKLESAQPSRTAMLDDPFVPVDAEKSAFDTDSESEYSDGGASGIRRQTSFRRLSNSLGKMRRVLGSSVSNHSANVRARLSLVAAGSSSTSSLPHGPHLEDSPESMASLRARQRTGESSDSDVPVHSFRRLAELRPCLSPIPATPMDLVPPPVDDGLGALDSPCSLPTPVTPNVKPTKSFIWDLEKIRSSPYHRELAASMPRLPTLSSATSLEPPPPLPLPPVPPSPSTKPALPVARARKRSSPSPVADKALLENVDRWRSQVAPDNRLTVVDPDVSRSRLEMTMAKLEAYAPRPTKPRRASILKVVNQDSPKVLSSSSEASDGEDEDIIGASPGVTVISVEPRKRWSFTSTEPSSAFSTEMEVKPSKPSVPAKVPPPHNRARSRTDPTKNRSLVLLPEFDFEQPGHRILDFNGLPMRIDSLPRDSILKASGSHSHSSSAATGSSLDASGRPLASAEPERSSRQRSIKRTGGDRLRRDASLPATPTYARPRTPPPVPPLPRGIRQHEHKPSDSEISNLSSFMDVSPQSQSDKRQRSRVRKLLNRVQVRTEFIKGIRESFTVGHHFHNPS